MTNPAVPRPGPAGPGPSPTEHTHHGYDGATPYVHDHRFTDAAHTHRHGHGTHPGQTHDHHLSETDDAGNLLSIHDHGPTDCGHLGDDVGTVRTVIRHRGAQTILCGPCGAHFDWAAFDARLDSLGAPPAPTTTKGPA